MTKENAKRPVKAPRRRRVREKLNAGIARQIGERILSGEFAPGSLLPNEVAWGKKFGVSRTSIREAIRALTAKGLITSRPKIGSRVEPRARWNLLDREVLSWHLNVADRKTFFAATQELRRLLEPGVAELAARKRSQNQLQQLLDALTTMKKARDHDAIVVADIAFHEALLQCCNNELLIPFGILIERTLAGLFDFTTGRNPRHRSALKLHEKVALAVSEGNPEAARKAMLNLIDDTDSVISKSDQKVKP